jgi:hypothetical protein
VVGSPECRICAVETEATPPERKVSPLGASAERGPIGEDAHGDTTNTKRLPATDRRPLHWLLEGLFIVVSVVLGFSLTEFGEYRNERELANRMIAGIRTEVEYNYALLKPFIPIHRAWQEALRREDLSGGTGSAVDVLLATRPELPREIQANIPLLRRAAWDTALSTGALRLIDYDLAAGLAEIYGMQDYAGAAFSKLFSDPSFFDPASRSATIRLAQTTMQELTWAEETLLALYDRHLPALRAGASSQ